MVDVINESAEMEIGRMRMDQMRSLLKVEHGTYCRLGTDCKRMKLQKERYGWEEENRPTNYDKWCLFSWKIYH